MIKLDFKFRSPLWAMAGCGLFLVTALGAPSGQAATLTLTFTGVIDSLEDEDATDGVDYNGYTQFYGTLTLPEAFTDLYRNTGSATGIVSGYQFISELNFFLTGGPGADIEILNLTEQITIDLIHANNVVDRIQFEDGTGASGTATSAYVLELSAENGSPLFGNLFNIGVYDSGSDTVTVPNTIDPATIPEVLGPFGEDFDYSLFSFSLEEEGSGDDVLTVGGYFTNLSVIPEPGIGVLAVLGLGGLMIGRRRHVSH